MKLKNIIKLSLKALLVCVLAFFFPKLIGFYLLCGILDFSRNGMFSLKDINRYFFGNGLLTWFLSPFNLLIDLLSFHNRKIYRLEDLPVDCQAELQEVIGTLQNKVVMNALSAQMEGKRRGMVFFKWYGKNLDTALKLPQLHRQFKYVRTIGVSIFNKKQSTSAHYGPLRLTFRVLYNLNKINSDKTYIQVMNHKHIWRENPFFSFDDTLLHQSINETDEVRFCMFVDILRPTHFPVLLDRLVTVVRIIMMRVNSIFYKNWDFLK